MLEAVARYNGLRFLPAEMAAIFDEADVDQRGQLDFNQVLRLLRSHGLRAFDPQAERRYFAKVKP